MEKKRRNSLGDQVNVTASKEESGLEGRGGSIDVNGNGLVPAIISNWIYEFPRLFGRMCCLHY